jgi:hypothetical protein
LRCIYWILPFIFLVTKALSAPVHLPFSPERAEADLSVVIDSRAPIDSAVLQAMEKELKRIFGPTDTLIELVIYRNRNESKVFESQVIMTRVVGECDALAAATSYTHKPDTLGRTFVTDGEILPFVELNCRQISGAVQQQIRAFPKDEYPVVLGRALARVLAHEIFHILAATMKHARHGIAAETMNAVQLTTERHDFRPEDFERMHLLPATGTF